MRLLSNSIKGRGVVFGVVIICLFSSAAQGQYCSASGGGQQYISGVIVGNLVNIGTGSDGYTDYTGMSTTITLGESQVATIINGLNIGGSQCGIWIDWNADSDFDDAGETVAMSGGPASFTATITAPGATTAGDKRMRVRIMGTGSLTPCGDTTYGEVEDYTIAVVAFWTGSGDANNPYQIWTAEDMNAIGASSGYWGAHFKLMANIDLGGFTGTSFNIIGTHLDNPFTGVFDGNGRTISNFTYTSTGTDNIGVFGYVDGASAEIKDLGLINPNIDAGTGSSVGALVGSNGGTISNCYVENGNASGYQSIGGLVGGSSGTITGCYVEGGSVSGAYNVVGGLVGGNGGTITDCYSSGSASGVDFVGGLVGFSTGIITDCYSSGSVSTGGWDFNVGGLVGANWQGGVITNCWSSASVSSTGSYRVEIGGLVGKNYGGIISNCYATGSVSGSVAVGGLVGNSSKRAGSGGIITNCYSTGSVSGSTKVGGLAGNSGGTITNCYSTGSVSGGGGGLVGTGGTAVFNSFWDVETSGRATSAGGTGKTTAEMQDPNTFLLAGWDFVDETDNGIEDIWRLCNEGIEYAQLNWQYLLGDFGCPDGVDWFDLGLLCDQWLFEELSADVAPGGGDGFVNFLDWAIFADGWQTTNDIFDLAEFADQWLKTGANYLIADIAPAPDGDGIVNLRDFATLANNWLQ